METNTSFSKGELVRYSNPEAGEESFLFLVVEDNGDRVFIQDAQWDTEKQGALRPIELVAKEDVCLA